MGPAPELHRRRRLPFPAQGGQQSVQHRIHNLSGGISGLILVAVGHPGGGLHQRTEEVRVLQNGLHAELGAVQIGELHPHGQLAAVGEPQPLPLQHCAGCQLRHMAQDTLLQRDTRLIRQVFFFLKPSKHMLHPISHFFKLYQLSQNLSSKIRT